MEILWLLSVLFSLVCFIRNDVPVFRFRVFPESSKAFPLGDRTYYEIIPDDFSSITIETIFLVEKLKTEFDNATVLETVNVTKRAPFITIFDYPGKRYHWYNESSSYSPEYIRVKIIENGEIVSTSAVKTIYWDMRFYNTDFNITFENKGPGKVVIHYSIRDYPELKKYLKFLVHIPRGFPGYSQISTLVQPSKEKHEIIIHECPSINYYQFFGQAGNIRAKSYDLAIKCCDYETGVCPTVHSEFLAKYNPIEHTVESVKSNVQFIIHKERITALENTKISVFMGHDHESVEIFLPFNLTLNPKFAHYIINEVSNDTCNHYFLTKKSSSWGYKNWVVSFSLHFNNHPYGSEHDIYLKVNGGEYQKLTVVLKQIPTLTNHPKRLQSGFIWGGIELCGLDMDLYKNMGYNQIGRFSTMGYFSVWEDTYTPENRANWTTEGMNFVLGASPLHAYNRHVDPKMFSMFKEDNASCTVQCQFRDQIKESKLPDFMSQSEKNSELQMWRNAFDFMYHPENRYRMIDPGYQGYVFQRQMEIITYVVDALKPDFVNFDCEGYGSYSWYVENLSGLSQNLLDKMQPGESYENAYWRVIDDMWRQFRKAVDDGLPGLPIILYGLNARNNAGYQTAKFDTFDKYGIVPQPSVYTTMKDIESLGIRIREDRLYLEGAKNVKDLVVMPSPGTYGFIDSEMYFDVWIHIFLNGATGIQFYGASEQDDPEFLLSYQEAVNIIVPFENVIINGSLAFYDFTVIEGLIIGSMKLDDTYVIAISSFNNDQRMKENGVFHLRYPHKYYKMKELRNEHVIKSQYLKQEIVVELDTKNLPMVVHVYSFKNQYVLSVVIACLVSGCLVLLLIAVIIVIVIVVVVLNLNGRDGTRSVRKEKEEQQMQTNKLI